MSFERGSPPTCPPPWRSNSSTEDESSEEEEGDTVSTTSSSAAAAAADFGDGDEMQRLCEEAARLAAANTALEVEIAELEGVKVQVA